MASMKEEVLAALAKVPSPDGKPLTQTDALSEIVATDGKVFFSITASAVAVKQWESVREQAEAAVRAMPGVKSVMVALTAERGGGGTPPPPPQPARPQAARPPGGAPAAPTGIPGVESIIAVASG